MYCNRFMFWWPPIEARVKGEMCIKLGSFCRHVRPSCYHFTYTHINCHSVRLQVVGTSANLTLDVDVDTAGRYYCKASVMGFPEVGAEASVYLKGPPTIISHRTQFGIQGDNVRLECVAFSIPKPEHVTWTYNGNEVDADDKDYTILEDPLPEGIKSTLVIRESRQQHFGPYNCSVTNPYGSDVAEINLKPQSKQYCSPLKLLKTKSNAMFS